MRRVAVPERPDWRIKADTLGFTFHTFDTGPYWDESAYYAFTLRQIEDDLESASRELHALCREVVERALSDERVLTKLAIPDTAWDAIRDSWRRGDPTLYGRFDLAYDGTGPAKLLEYNADTPTALYETAAFQWFWLEDLMAAGTLPPHADQFNSLHERVIWQFKALGAAAIHFTCMAEEREDRGTVLYLEDCARQAGLSTSFVPIEQIGLDREGRFVDQSGRPIQWLFKLYPWEWMVREEFGTHIGPSGLRFLEPPWKMVLSNKGILPLLWDLTPGHHNLLASYFEDDPRKHTLGRFFARKPLYSREGANVLLVREAAVLDRDEGPYGAEGYVRQALVELPRFEGRYAAIGSWVVGDEPGGICIRESDTPITTNRSRFVPHAILG